MLPLHFIRFMPDSCGMSEGGHVQEFVSLRPAAARSGVPLAWLAADNLAGRLPRLRVGRRLLLNLDVLRGALHNQADRRNGGAVQ